MKRVKITDNKFLDSNYIVHNKSKLSVLINKILNRTTALEQSNFIKHYSLNVNDSKFDDVRQIIGNVKDGEMYCITNYPISDGNFIQNGASHTVLGMQYGDFEYGSQLSFGLNGIRFRTQYDGVWREWQSK